MATGNWPEFGSIDTRSAAKTGRLPRGQPETIWSDTTFRSNIAHDDSVLGGVTKFPQPGISQITEYDAFNQYGGNLILSS